jgi:23S rRNA pseudouridine1911/1915/1917 synthase
MPPLKIIYEDNQVIVCEKPSGLLSQPDDSEGENLYSIIFSYLSEKETEPYVGVIHRLDRGVGGIMVYAKNRNAAAELSSQITGRIYFIKQYIAAVHGKTPEEGGEMKDLLFYDRFLGKSFVVDKPRRGAKEASLYYKTVAYSEENDISLVKISLNTGRTHQIRVQFASRGFPLAGDKKYGAKDMFSSIGLWSYSVGFLNPGSKKSETFYSLPDTSAEPWQIFKDNIDYIGKTV